jgi:hypothetical protein
MNEQDLANTALACAVLDHRDEQVLAGLLQHTLWQQTSSSDARLTTQGMCNLCWSVAVLELQQLAGSVVQLVQAAASSQQQWREFASEELMQLHQVHLWLLDRQLVGGRGLAGALTQQQLQQCSGAWREQLRATAAELPVQFEHDVLAALQQLTAAGALSWQRPPAPQQPAVPDGACLIDIAGVTADGVRLAVEVDGPTHFLWPDRRLNGRTQHRNRVLAARGYAVVGVPYFEWDKRADYKQQPSAQQVQYLLQLINIATQQHQGNTQHYRYQQQQQQQQQQAVQGTLRRRTRSSSSQQRQSDSSAQQQQAQLSRSQRQQVKEPAGAAAGFTPSPAAAAAATSRTSPSGRVRGIRQRTAQ